MFHIVKCDSYDEVSRQAFKIMQEVLKKDHPVLGLATGSSPVGLYKEMIRDHRQNGTSYKDVVTFNLDEYIGIPRNHPQSYYTFMHENLFNDLDCPEENIHVPEGDRPDEEQACIDYENALKKVTMDIQVLGIGRDGHIAFNEPGTPFNSETHLMNLKEETIADNARFFGGDVRQVPKRAITQGLASIMRSKKIILIAAGTNKAQAIHDMIQGPRTEACPASVLQTHPDVTVFLDKDAASLL